MAGIPLRYSLLLAAGLFAAIALSHVAFAGQYPEAVSIGSGNPTFQVLGDRFTTLADEKGAAYAFGVLKLATVPAGTDMHLLGHIVGDVLYQQKGISGIQVCTQDFRNACSHAIVIGALNEFGTGESTIEKIRNACEQAPGGAGAYTMCFHGLGHGVFAYFKYDIPKTVAFCKRLGTAAYEHQEYTECVGGMIMELIDGGGHDHDLWSVAREKYLDPKDPLSPCDRALIPADAKSYCYTYLTPRLFEAAGADLNAPDPATFPKAFTFCSAIQKTDLKAVCYGSFGKEFVPLAGDRDIRIVDQFSDVAYKKAIGWCMLAPGQTAQGECIGQALASVFWGGENDPDAAFRFCGLVQTGVVKDTCYRELSRNIASYVTGNRRNALCDRLPAQDIHDCKTAQYGPAERP